LKGSSDFQFEKMRMPFSLIGQAKFTSSNLDDAGQASLQVITALNIVAL
jgi:hypothetical protein